MTIPLATSKADTRSDLFLNEIKNAAVEKEIVLSPKTIPPVATSTGRKTAIVMAITMLILIPIGTIAKEIVGRMRPAMPDAELLVAPDSGYSFPSGHAVIASSGAALMLALFRGSYKKLAVSIGLAVEAALVCFSRVYVGDHYPLDIAGGILLGVGVAFIFISVTKRVEQLLQPLTKALKP
ncbi:MAG: phosphatase PAP2 family protein [Thermoproteota archaeon]|nr:phosphatase PAP2 family protein [Thermoproteota archaeon]